MTETTFAVGDRVTVKGLAGTGMVTWCNEFEVDDISADIVPPWQLALVGLVFGAGLMALVHYSILFAVWLAS